MKKRKYRFPKMLPEPVLIYGMGGPYPDQMRCSFTDGSTQIYDLRVKQPAPCLKDDLDAFTELCIGYKNGR